MTPEEIIKFGKFVFGNRWVTDFAKVMGRRRETIEDWKNRVTKNPPLTWKDFLTMETLAKAKREDGIEWCVKLKQYAQEQKEKEKS